MHACIYVCMCASLCLCVCECVCMRACDVLIKRKYQSDVYSR